MDDHQERRCLENQADRNLTNFEVRCQVETAGQSIILAPTSSPFALPYDEPQRLENNPQVKNQALPINVI